ncbi:MAG TPA: hypothetical protein PKA64_07105 [Myxococcota bacterium]|nr:hypothetical protein [Myxococcota bacterium]
MADPTHARLADDVARELDLLVYRLEQPAPADPAKVAEAWAELRRKLERLRESAETLARGL